MVCEKVVRMKIFSLRASNTKGYENFKIKRKVNLKDVPKMYVRKDSIYECEVCNRKLATTSSLNWDVVYL